MGCAHPKGDPAWVDTRSPVPRRSRASESRVWCLAWRPSLWKGNQPQNCWWSLGLPKWLSGKESACQAGDADSIPGSGRSPGEWNDNPLQYSCLRNPTDRGDLEGYSPWGHKESDIATKQHNNLDNIEGGTTGVLSRRSGHGRGTTDHRVVPPVP